MNSESENNKKLKDFFGKEYQSLKIYVSNRINDTTSRNAEDIIQDVALKLFSSADTYGPINNVGGFVYRSIKNKIIDIMRKGNSNREVRLENNNIDITEVHISLLENSSEEQITALKQHINELKPHYRDIILAVDFEGYSYKEISNETGIPEGTLMSRRHRALGILYKKLDNKI